MAQMRNQDKLVISLFVNLILLIALAVCLLLIVFSPGKTAPVEADEDDLLPRQLNIDEDALLNRAADFSVSTEYLELVLPDYLVFRDKAAYVYHRIDPALGFHEYNWDNLSYVNDRTYYADENYPNVSYGIDVSSYQGEIDWPLVAADGVEFAIIRLGFRGYGSGKLVVDDYAAANLAGATAANIPIGAYFFSQAITEEEAVEEAEMALSLLQGYELSYPVVFDMEDIEADGVRADVLTVEQRTQIADAFCRRIEQAGYTPMIYGNVRWLAGRLDLEQLIEWPIWFAQYYYKPMFPYNFDIWQYSSTGTVAGISTDVDLNICFKQPVLEDR